MTVLKPLLPILQANYRLDCRGIHGLPCAPQPGYRDRGSRAQALTLINHVDQHDLVRIES